MVYIAYASNTKATDSFPFQMKLGSKNIEQVDKSKLYNSGYSQAT